MSTCPGCGSSDVYQGLDIVECPTAGCRNFTQRQCDKGKVTDPDTTWDDVTTPFTPVLGEQLTSLV